MRFTLTEYMLNDEGELIESEEALTKNIAIFLSTIIKIYHIFPKKLFVVISGIVSFLLIAITLISAFFNYDKMDLDTITLDSILSLFTLEFIVLLLLVIVISFVLLLIKGFYNYIDKTEKHISNYKDKLELIKEQNMVQPIFLNKNLIKNMISEIKNYISLKESGEIIEKYISVIDIKLGNNKIIEITASNKDISFIDKRMILEIYKQTQIRGHLVHDSYGLVSVVAYSGETFKSILIDPEPEYDYWEKMTVYLGKNTCESVDDLYLKVYIPEDILQTNEDTLNGLLTGLNQL